MSNSVRPKKIVHPRQRPCPNCGARPGEPCVLRTGKPLKLIHCTIRLTGYSVEGTWKPPQHGSRQEPDSSQNEADNAVPATTSGATGIPNKNAGEVAQTQPIQPPDTSHDQEPHPEAPAAQDPVGAPADVAPTEPAPSPPSKKKAPGETLEDQKDVFDGGSNLFQSGKPKQKTPRQSKEGNKSARAQAEPSLF